MRAALALLLVACNARVAPTEAPSPERASVATPWVAARAPESGSLLEMPAQVESAPQSSGAVMPPYPARVLRILSRPGETVTRGAPLVEVVMPQLVTAAGAYGAARTRGEAYGKRKAQLEALRAEGLARLSELSDVETRLAEARADEQSALATLRAAGVAPDEAARLLANGGTTTLRSPVAGVITELSAVVGETRDAGGKPLARIAGAGPLRVVARLAHALPPEARFELLLPAGAAPLPLRLVSQAPVVDARDGTTQTWFEPLAPTSALSGGASARLRILPPAGVAAVVVPAAAVARARGQAFVVVRGEPARRVAVRVLASSGADALVSGALAVGELVASDGAAVAGDAGAP